MSKFCSLAKVCSGNIYQEQSRAGLRSSYHVYLKILKAWRHMKKMQKGYKSFKAKVYISKNLQWMFANKNTKNVNINTNKNLILQSEFIFAWKGWTLWLMLILSCSPVHNRSWQNLKTFFESHQGSSQNCSMSSVSKIGVGKYLKDVLCILL